MITKPNSEPHNIIPNFIGSPLVFGGVCVAHLLSFLCCVLYFTCLRLVYGVVSFSGLFIIDYPFGFL